MEIYIALKNAFLVILIIAILHFLIYNYTVFTDPVPVASATAVPVTEPETTGGVETFASLKDDEALLSEFVGALGTLSSHGNPYTVEYAEL